MNAIPAALLDAMYQVNDLLRQGDFRAAHDRLETIVRGHPDFVEAKRLLAGTMLALGDAGGAEVLLRRAMALEPDWTPTLTMLGELLLNAGRYAEAEQLLQQAAHARAADPRAALILARYLNDRRRHADALAIAAPFCAAANAAPELAVQHVIALAAQGQADEAVAFYRRRAADSPDDPATAHALAIALQATHSDTEAEQTADKVIARGYRNASLSYTHARSLIALGAFERAEAALRACLQMEPQHTEAHAELARLVWIRTGDSAQATEWLDQVLKKFPGNDALWAVRAAVLQGAGEAHAAYTCLVPRIGRTHAPPALLLRAGLAALEFDPNIALDLASRALLKLPCDAAAMKLLAAACLGLGDARKALALGDTLLGQAPDDQYLIALQTTAWRILGDERYWQLCDYPALVVPYRLDVPAPWGNLSDFLGDLKRGLGKLHDAFRHRLLFQSLRHGTETTGDLSRSTDPAVQALFRAFDAPLRDYLARIGHGADPLRHRNTGTYRFSGGWSVRLRAPGFHRNHVHPNGWISSACYIDLPGVMGSPDNREGVLVFAEPGILTTPALPSQHEVRPAVGTLVLFPSYFWHGTLPFSGDQPRLTVAFDAVPGTASSTA